MPERVSELVAEHPIPMVLHGGTGLTESQFTDLIARGCAKVNISTALKIAFVDAHREYLDANPCKHDPPALLKHVRTAVKGLIQAGRLELRVLFEESLARYPNMEPAGEPTWVVSTFVNQLKSLPVRLAPVSAAS